MLRHLFGLPSITAESLGVSCIGGQVVGPDVEVCPVLSALPMGWGRSVWLCQQFLLQLLPQIEELCPEKFLCDKHAAPCIGDGIWTVYLGNIALLSANINHGPAGC